MSRPLKQGIDYFPIDVGFLKDVKIRKIKLACGTSSPAILIALLSNIYCDNGYYIEWDDDMPFLIADEVGVSEGAVSETVIKAVQVGLFDKNIFERFRVLTSKGIQKRFVKAVERRNTIEIAIEYLLLEEKDINDNINLVNVYINSVNADRSTQSKVKESKIKESNKLLSRACAHEEKSVFEKTIDDFIEMRKKIKKPATERAIKTIRNKLRTMAPDDETMQIHILEQSIERCWQTVYPLKNDNDWQNKKQSRNSQPDKRVDYI